MTRIQKLFPILLIGVLLIVGAGVVIGTNYRAFFPAKNMPVSGSKLDQDIQNAEQVVAQKPSVTRPYLTLAALYLQKVRETSDASYYAKITALMETAAKINPEDADIPATQASVAMGRHDFVAGKEYITKALELNKNIAAYYGLDADADIELGRYEEAVSALQKMVDMRPSFSSWSRIAYIRELYGDIPGAKQALTEAISSGSNYPENIAWAYVEQGKLEMRTNLEAATNSFNEALRILPTYTPAMEGLGKVAFAKNELPEAEKQFTAAYTGLPLAQYAIDLGDFYTATGNTAKASQQYALAQVAFAQSTDGGVNTDLEESLFLSDHDLDLPNALAMAKRAYVARPSIYAADYLSWALYKNGKTAEALTYSSQALRLGKNDPTILFHQGILAQAGGDTVHAREYLTKAKALNPHFSVQYARVLTITLDSLR